MSDMGTLADQEVVSLEVRIRVAQLRASPARMRYWVTISHLQVQITSSEQRRKTSRHMGLARSSLLPMLFKSFVSAMSVQL
jgi:hypothetical protein